MPWTVTPIDPPKRRRRPQREPGAGPRNLYVSNPLVWDLARDIAARENLSLSAIVETLLEEWIKTQVSK